VYAGYYSYFTVIQSTHTLLLSHLRQKGLQLIQHYRLYTDICLCHSFQANPFYSYLYNICSSQGDEICLEIAYREALGRSMHHTHCLITDEDRMWRRERERRLMVSILKRRGSDM